MKSRGIKSGKPAGRAKKAPGSGVTDISPSSSLPPLVEGPLRSFLRVTVSKILWTVQRPPPCVLVRLRWWGETSNGTIFYPRDPSQTNQKTVKTTTRYAVHCGPKQLTSYLTDMGALVLEIMTKPDHLPLGRAQITRISRLSPEHPINGSFTIVSPASEKLGELQVSVALEPLDDTNDDNPIPNTDFSLGTAYSGHQQQPDSLQPSRLPLNPRAHRDSDTSRVSTPRGHDQLYFKENSEPNRNSLKDLQSKSERYIPDTANEKHSTNHITREGLATEMSSAPSAPATKDLLSVLLQQGSKLCDAMAESALRLDPSTDVEADLLLPPVMDQQDYAVRTALDYPPSRVHPDMIHYQKTPVSTDLILHPADQTLPDPDVPSDTRAIELLLGSSPVSLGRYWDGTGSPPDSIAGSDFYESELNDPHYDQSLLEHLFYAAPKSLGEHSGHEEPIRPVREDNEKPKTQTKEELNDSRVKAAGRSDPEIIDVDVDRLILLSQMRVARVVVETLKVKPESLPASPSNRSKGKPPRPAPVKRTYFVEFHFPVSSKNKAGEVSVANEITRMASSKITNGVVRFQQRSIFPVLFTGDMIQQWWSSGLTFRVYLRKGTQKKPQLLGSATFRLKEVLRSPELSVTCSVPVLGSEEGPELKEAGPLKVSVAIAEDSREFSSIPDKLPAGPPEAPPPSLRHSVRSTGPPDVPNSTLRHSIRFSSPEHHREEIPTEPEQLSPITPPRLPSSSLHNPIANPEVAEEEPGLLLHVFLLVPQGEGLVPGADASSLCNPYLNCKLFSSQEASRSNVVWSSNQPAFNFSLVAPVSVTKRLLERMKNNVMVIEVWNKAVSSSSDQLMGLAKLPLHQLYMSFSDEKIRRLLLQAQYPVIAADGFVPITDVFSGSERGRLKVLLAMGSGDQVVALQRLKSEEGTSLPSLPRPAHFLDPPQPLSEISRGAESVADHVFEFHVADVKGLTPLQSTVWGEADCFVQYYFPVQTAASDPGADLPERGVSLKPVRTATTLCVPDPVINDRQSHTLAARSDTPVQRLLLSAYSTQGLAGGGGVTFEIWCRYYYPNVRDQMVAKAVLPLSRLCAMITMHHREAAGCQAFSLPLTLKNESPADAHPSSSGLLNVNVTYRRSVRNPAALLATRMVSISVQIHRAAGLQAAARALAEKDPAFQYSAEVGVNAFIVIRPSFLPESESRSTRTVARSFCPEFDHHSEFPCNLVMQRSGGETCSLAEVLHCSEIVFSIHHQSVTAASGPGRAPPAPDYPLGLVRIPARDLLAKRSGVSGWFPVLLPEDVAPPITAGVMSNVAGGVELSVRFAHHSDQERVLEAARGLGWDAGYGGPEESWQREDLVTLSVTIPKVWLPVSCLLLAGHKRLHKSTFCYMRYKLYDRDAVCSPLRRPLVLQDGERAAVEYEQTRSIEVMKHQPLVWYLREEKLEIQIWRSYGKDTAGPRPQDTDRLLGCAYVDMSALAEDTPRTLSVSGVYPLFKRNVPDLQGAAVRVHLTLRSACHPTTGPGDTSSAEDQSLSEGEEDHSTSMDHNGLDDTNKATPPQDGHSPPVTDGQPISVDLEETFAVNVVVERAMHLSLKGSPLTERRVSSPSCCVSFPVADRAEPIVTPVMENSDSPVWNFQHQTRLTKDLLLDPRQTLVFKVWHKSRDVDRVLGFSSVDLSLLLSGFHSVSGWYNVVDFTGQCQGQIKVSVTPLEDLSGIREERRVRSGTGAAQTQASFLYQAGSTFSFPPHQTADIAGGFPGPSKRGEALSRGADEEPSETLRRFQESVHQAEENARSARHLTTLPQASQTSLLSALRKNLRELDDIQMYFNQKLYRSLPGTAPPAGPSMNYKEPHPPVPPGGDEDAEAQSLLRKSSLLVSQVSSLITGLQEKATFRETPSGTNQDGRRDQRSDVGQYDDGFVKSHDHRNLSDNEREYRDRDVWSADHRDQSGDERTHRDINVRTGDRRDRSHDEQEGNTRDAWSGDLRGRSHDEQEGHTRDAWSGDLRARSHDEQEGHTRDAWSGDHRDRSEDEQDIDTRPFSAAAPLRGKMNYMGDLLGFLNEEEEEQGENIEEDNDGDYEESVIEPKTLNEFTALTDRTSPWSSMASEPEPDSTELHPIRGQDDDMNRDLMERLDRFSPIQQDDQQSNPSTGRSRDSCKGHDADHLIGSDEDEGSDPDRTEEESESKHDDTLRDSGDSPNLSERPRGETWAAGISPTGYREEDEAPDPQDGGERDHRKSDCPSSSHHQHPQDTEGRDEDRSDYPSSSSSSHHQDRQDGGARDEDKSDYPSSSSHHSASRRNSSPSVESSEDTKHHTTHLLSNPIQLPNFFLPPQHLEASMRLLSQASALPSSSASVGGTESRISKGIPFRRRNRQTPKMPPEELPQEEANRIARIFAARFNLN